MCWEWDKRYNRLNIVRVSVRRPSTMVWQKIRSRTALRERPCRAWDKRCNVSAKAWIDDRLWKGDLFRSEESKRQKRRANNKCNARKKKCRDSRYNLIDCDNDNASMSENATFDFIWKTYLASKLYENRTFYQNSSNPVFSLCCRHSDTSSPFVSKE